MEAIDILENIGSIVPVIGENCFYYYGHDGQKIPLQDFLIDEIIKMRNAQHLDERIIVQMKRKGFYGLSLCRQRLGFARDEEFLKCYKRIIREHKDCIHLDETIKLFLKTYKFHLIVTTCCFDFIEADMPWYSSKVYVAANGANNKEEIDPQSYIVYHVFGKADNASRWAWDEESLMYILHCHHDNDYASNGLHRYLFPDQNTGQSYKSLLVLYSNLPDWLFRFFLYPLAFKGQWSSGFYMNNVDGSDVSLRNFIERVICYDIEEERIKAILEEAISMQETAVVKDADRVSHSMEYDIFISHSSEDESVAKDIKSKLESLYGLNIWLDVNGGIEDGSYEEKIKYGLENSAYFMPLITRSYIGKLGNGKCAASYMTIDDILKDDKSMTYVQKEALAADLHWKRLRIKEPHRKTYLLPLIFPDSNITYETIQQCATVLGQLPEMFLGQTIFTYTAQLLFDKDWSRYKTVERA